MLGEEVLEVTSLNGQSFIGLTGLVPNNRPFKNYRIDSGTGLYLNYPELHKARKLIS